MATLGFGTPRSAGYDAAPVRSPAESARDIAVFPLTHSARLLDLLISLLIVVRMPVPGLPTGSFDQLGLFLLVTLAVFRRPIRSVPVWYPGLALVLMAYLAFESAVVGVEPQAFVQRVLNISLSLVTVGFMASGRMDVAAMIKGIAIGLGLTTIAFYAGLTPRPYDPFLTTLLMDKNVSGLFFATMPFLIAASQPRTWQRLAVLAAAAPLLWLTGSRTSMAAFAAGLAWLVLAPRTNWLGKLALGGALYGLFDYASDNLAQIGRFAARSGSDLLRDRIDEATAVKVSETPWYGQGLSTATVEVDGSTWFFHNSYAALWVEGGVVMTVLVLGLYGGVLVALSRFAVRRGTADMFAGTAFAGLVAGSASRIGGVLPPSSRAANALLTAADRRGRARHAAVEVGTPGGGWLTLEALTAALRRTVVTAAHRARSSFAEQAAAAAMVSVLLCAWRLGEVFMAQGPFIVVGVALALLVQHRPYQSSPWVVATPGDDR